MLKTKVILSQVTNLSDARYAAGMGVDYIGFSIDPENSAFVTVDAVKNISNWLSGVSLVADIGHSLTANIAAYATVYVQTSNPALVDELDEPILAFNLSVENPDELNESLARYARQVNFFILKIEAEQLSALQSVLTEICNNYRVYISTVFDEENLAFLLREIQPTGIVLYGSDEEKPGLSSYDGIADILEQLEED